MSSFDGIDHFMQHTRRDGPLLIAHRDFALEVFKDVPGLAGVPMQDPWSIPGQRTSAWIFLPRPARVAHAFPPGMFRRASRSDPAIEFAPEAWADDAIHSCVLC